MKKSVLTKEKFVHEVIEQLVEEVPYYTKEEISKLLAEHKNADVLDRFYTERFLDAVKRGEDANKAFDYATGLASNYFFMSW